MMARPRTCQQASAATQPLRVASPSSASGRRRSPSISATKGASFGSAFAASTTARAFFSVSDEIPTAAAPLSRALPDVDLFSLVESFPEAIGRPLPVFRPSSCLALASARSFGSRSSANATDSDGAKSSRHCKNAGSIHQRIVTRPMHASGFALLTKHPRSKRSSHSL
jgi:hypothetical protein